MIGGLRLGRKFGGAIWEGSNGRLALACRVRG